MGLLKDAMDLGYINQDQYDDLAETWSDYGYDERHYGEVESMQKMMEDFMELGFEDLVEKISEEWFKAIDHYEKLYNYEIFYSPASERWHNTATGQFVSDPYEWIRD